MPTCSANTRVRSPLTRISGRNDAGRALRDVGATSTTDRGRSSSACVMALFARRTASGKPFQDGAGVGFGVAVTARGGSVERSLGHRPSAVVVVTLVAVGE